MSAYVVEDETINRIATWLRDGRYNCCFSKLEELGYSKTTDKSLSLLVTDMLAMNVKAVNARYGENAKPSFLSFKPVQATIIQVYKSLECFLYQCSEGDVHKEPLYIALKAATCDLAKEIIGGLKSYNEAKWG
jgi:hypothetical protein